MTTLNIQVSGLSGGFIQGVHSDRAVDGGEKGAAWRGGKKIRYSETDQLDFPIPTSHMVRS